MAKTIERTSTKSNAQARSQRQPFRPKDLLNQVVIGRPDCRVDRLERIEGWFEKHLASASHT